MKKKLFFTTMALCTFGFLFSCDTQRRNNISISRIKIDSVKNPSREKWIYLPLKPLKLILLMLYLIDFMIKDYRIDN